MNELFRNDAIRCLHCNEEFVHQGKIQIFERYTEDALTGVHLTCNRLKIEMDDKMDGNPSGRRQGISIELTCELCQGMSILKIVQHKGQTYIGLEK